MNGFRFSEHIASPPHEVFAVISDPTLATGFLDNIVDSLKLTDGPIGVGTVFRETRVVSGKQASADLTTTVYKPDTHVCVRTEAEGITVAYQYRLRPDGDGTLLEWTCELEAGGLRKMMLPMVAAIMKKEDGDHLQRLKAYIEKGRDEAKSRTGLS